VLLGGVKAMGGEGDPSRRVRRMEPAWDTTDGT
jgi:hypothetical protein